MKISKIHKVLELKAKSQNGNFFSLELAQNVNLRFEEQEDGHQNE